MSAPCKYVKRDLNQKIVECCNVMAGPSGLCPRHEMLIPALAAAAAQKAKEKLAKRQAELRKGARRR